MKITLEKMASLTDTVEKKEPQIPYLYSSKINKYAQRAVKDVLKTILKEARRECSHCYDDGSLVLYDLGKVDHMLEDIGDKYHLTVDYSIKKGYKVINKK